MTKPLVICIIDDDMVSQFVLSKIIQKNTVDKTIITFSNGQDAIDYLQENAKNIDKIPDLIFLDNIMPIVDGWEFLEQYKKIKSSIDKKTAIYMVSASIDPADYNRAAAITEVTDSISKPPTTEVVNEIVTLIIADNSNLKK